MEQKDKGRFISGMYFEGEDNLSVNLTSEGYWICLHRDKQIIWKGTVHELITVATRKGDNDNEES